MRQVETDDIYPLKLHNIHLTLLNEEICLVSQQTWHDKDPSLLRDQNHRTRWNTYAGPTSVEFKQVCWPNVGKTMSIGTRLSAKWPPVGQTYWDSSTLYVFAGPTLGQYVTPCWSNVGPINT